VTLGNPDRPVGGLAVPTPAGVELRPIGRDDFEVALALARELYALPQSEAEPHRASFEALVGDVDAASFLAVADGAPAGLVLLRFRRRLNHATFEGWISDLVVPESFRRRGIGRALLMAAIAEWRLRRGHQITLEVAYQRSAARALYESLGFEEAGKYFEIAPVATRGVGRQQGLEIRPIVDDDGDFAATTRLLAELGRPAPSDERMPAVRRTYAQHVRRTDTASLLALAAGEPIGFCSIEVRRPFYMTRPQIWIPDLIVTEAARGRGAGAALLDAAFAVARERDAYAVALESGGHRAVAHRLYAAAGMAEVGSFYVLRADRG
jgi:ribosomal protein S18 acetylase RimI-like enzyme